MGSTTTNKSLQSRNTLKVKVVVADPVLDRGRLRVGECVSV